MAEDEIVSRNHVCRLKPPDQGALDEINGAEAGKGIVEPLHDQQVAAQLGDLSHLGAKGGQPERRLVGLEQLPGVGLERQHRPGPPLVAGDHAGFVDDRLMAAVHAVEVADGDGGPTGVLGQGVVMAKNPHGGKVSAPPGCVKGKRRGKKERPQA